MPVFGSKKGTGRNVVEMARERLNVAFDNYDTVVLSFSGGKDSTIVLNLAAEVAAERGRLPLKVIFNDEEANFPETVEYMERVNQREDIDLTWLCIPCKAINGCSRREPWWYPWAPEEEELWIRSMPESATTHEHIEGYPPIYPKEDRLSLIPAMPLVFPALKYGTVGVLMGVRAQESITRYRAVARLDKKRENFISPFPGGTVATSHINKVYPIYDWSTEDVWTAPKREGWDYNRAYDLMFKFGIHPFGQRISSPLVTEAIQDIGRIKETYPEFWDKLLKRADGVSTAARYGSTELYGTGKYKMTKPADMTWKEYLAYIVKKYDPDTQVKLAKRLKTFFKLHQARTTDPIAGNSFHPWTGVSYEWLVRIAMRARIGHHGGGSAPEKNLPTKKIDPTRERFIEKYQAEIRQSHGDEVADTLQCLKGIDWGDDNDDQAV